MSSSLSSFTRRAGLVLLGCLLTGNAQAQEAPAAAPAVSAPAEVAAPPAAVPPAAVPGVTASANANDRHGHGKKDEYTGPNTLVELPPTPMLDEEGKQCLDPDGKPIFNPAILQQRDKKGHPLFDEGGKPVMRTATELGYDENGKKLHAPKVKPPKALPVSIARGTLTVDGMTAKAALNYDIPDLKYIYLSAPGVGVVVVSPEPFPGATAQPHGFDGNTLLVKVGDHTLELTSDKPLLEKGVRPAYVLLDRGFAPPSPAPMMGYGTLRKAPYAWPGARPNAELAGIAAPPVPENMRPAQLLKPCPAGQMRKALTAAAGPQGTVQEPPCVPIRSGK